MATYRRIIPLVFLFFFISNQLCLGNSFLFLNQDGTPQPAGGPALDDDWQTDYMLAARTDGLAGWSESTGDGLNAEKLHKYLGYATVLLAGLTAISSSSEDAHYAAAYATVAASVGTFTTGYLAHGDRFTFGDGIFTEDNNHIILGTLGVLGCIGAVALADSDGGNSHDKIGTAGGVIMAVSVITIKW